MKEIWKLIELLNEYGNEICNHWGDYQTDMDFTDRDTYWYLSKKFWWIWWLVENDKIDLWKIKKLYRKSNEHSIHTYPIMYDYSDYESLLMLLAIQDEPIRFLCEIIK